MQRWLRRGRSANCDKHHATTNRDKQSQRPPSEPNSAQLTLIGTIRTKIQWCGGQSTFVQGERTTKKLRPRHK